MCKHCVYFDSFQTLYYYMLVGGISDFSCLYLLMPICVNVNKTRKGSQVKKGIEGEINAAVRKENTNDVFNSLGSLFTDSPVMDFGDW